MKTLDVYLRPIDHISAVRIFRNTLQISTSQTRIPIGTTIGADEFAPCTALYCGMWVRHFPIGVGR